jgi:hypothetical protein
MISITLPAGIIRSFKARYRKKLVRWLLDAIHAKIDRKLDILEAVRFAISSWEDVPDQVIRNCWCKCAIMDPTTIAELTQMRDYSKSVDQSVEGELATLMEGLSCDVTVAQYIDAEDDEPIECDQDTLERAAAADCADESADESAGESVDERTIPPSEALDCCLRLSSFLAMQHDSDEAIKRLSSITEHVRKQCSLRKTQSTIDSFFRVGSD